MHLRMKAAHHFGSLRKSGEYDSTKVVLPGCMAHRERSGLTTPHSERQGMVWRAEAARVAASGSKKRSPPQCLSMQLNHGDMVVMHGADIQRYYEVSESISSISPDICSANSAAFNLSPY